MNMVKIICPKCGAEGKLSLVETSYVGPRRCWKCHELFTITITNNKVVSSEPLSEEDYQRQQEAKNSKDKSGNFMESARHDEPEPPLPQLTPERRRNYTTPVTEPSHHAEPEKPSTPLSPPDRFRTFVPLEEPSSHEEPGKPPAPKTPPDRFRTFIPPAT